MCPLLAFAGVTSAAGIVVVRRCAVALLCVLDAVRARRCSYASLTRFVRGVVAKNFGLGGVQSSGPDNEHRRRCGREKLKVRALR